MPTFNAPRINGPATAAAGPASDKALIGGSPQNQILIYTSLAVVLGTGFLVVESDRRGALSLFKGIATASGRAGGLFVGGRLAEPRLLLADAPAGDGPVVAALPPMWLRDP